MHPAKRIVPGSHTGLPSILSQPCRRAGDDKAWIDTDPRNASGPTRVQAATDELRRSAMFDLAAQKARNPYAAPAEPTPKPPLKLPPGGPPEARLRHGGYADPSRAGPPQVESAEAANDLDISDPDAPGGKEGEVIGAVAVSPLGQIKLCDLEKLPKPALERVRPCIISVARPFALSLMSLALPHLLCEFSVYQQVAS